jgi:hypothetical protein
MKGTAMTEYTWTLATGDDVGDIVKMAEQHFQQEIDTIFTPEPPVMTRNLIFAVTNQFFLPGTELVAVARDTATHQLQAYTWAKSGDRTVWSDDPMVSVRMAHVDLALSARQRVRLVTDMMDHWERFARYCNHRVICSTTMRHDQGGFLRLHERHGYSVRGSYAYKLLDAVE